MAAREPDTTDLGVDARAGDSAVRARAGVRARVFGFLAEASTGAPLLERLRDRRWGDDGGEYVRLVPWMEDWVGVENDPDEVAVGEAMRKADPMRQWSSQSIK